MKREKKDLPDPNMISTPLIEFMEYYNRTIPDSFPRVTKEDLEQFQKDHASLFSIKKEWTIDKHRKKLMDWAVSRPKIV